MHMTKHQQTPILALAASFLALLAVQDSSAAQQKFFEGHGEGASDRFIVVLEPASSAKSAIEARKALISEYGGKVKYVYDTQPKGFSIQMSESEARKMSEDKLVRYVERVTKVFVDGSGVQNSGDFWGILFGLDRLDQRSFPLDNSFSWNFDGSGVTAYFVDTGVYPSHPYLVGRTSHGANFTGLGGHGGYAAEPSSDCNGHGTSIAGLIGSSVFGVAKNVNLVSVKALYCDGTGWSDEISAAVDWITRNAKRPAVVNMSLSAPLNSLSERVRSSVASGLTFVVAGGNAKNGVVTNAENRSPANVVEAITVGWSAAQYDTPHPWSNFGSVIDVWAPGDNFSTQPLPAYASLYAGTSQATALVSGAVAQMLSARPFLLPSEVQSKLTTNATQGVLAGLRPGDNNRLLNTSWINRDFATDCSLSGWSAAYGQVSTGTPQSSVFHRRVSDPCGIRTASIGSFVELNSSQNTTYGNEHGARFYFYPEGASSSPITIFEARNNSGWVLYQVRLNGSTIQVLDSNGAVRASSTARIWGWNSVELRWSAAAPSPLTFEHGYMNGLSSVLAASTVTGVGTSSDSVASVRMGQVSGSANSMVIGFDAFVHQASYGNRIGRVLRGETNLDGGVSGPDVIDVQTEAYGGRLSLGQPDCNEDGGVSGGDVICVQYLATGVNSQ